MIMGQNIKFAAMFHDLAFWMVMGSYVQFHFGNKMGWIDPCNYQKRNGLTVYTSVYRKINNWEIRPHLRHTLDGNIPNDRMQQFS